MPPTCPTCPAPPSVVDAPPVPAPPPAKPETDDLGNRPAILTTDLATIVVEVHEGEGDSDEPELHLHIRVAPPRGTPTLLERASPPGECAEAEPSVVFVGSDEENEVVDVQLVCTIGEEVVRQYIEHTVVHLAMKNEEVSAEVVFTGLSSSRNNRRLALESDGLELHVEAGALAIYRQRAAWCDREGLKTLMGPELSGCTTRERTLTLVKRVPL